MIIKYIIRVGVFFNINKRRPFYSFRQSTKPSFSTMEDWYEKWQFKVDQIKSIYITFTHKQAQCPALWYPNSVILDCKIFWFNTRPPTYLGLPYQNQKSTTELPATYV